MKPTITLFDADTIDQLPWPNTKDGIYARSYLLPFIKCGPTHFIDNVKTQCMVLLIDKQVVLPISVNVQEYDNSFVCSPYSHYVTYAKEELVLIQQQWLRVVLSALIDSFGIFCKLCGINRVVHVNNWLLSTNLYPDLCAEYVTAIIDLVKERFPQHTIIFRSLNNYGNASLLDALKNDGCKFVPSRQVYLVHPNLASLSKKARWQLKRDFALLKKHGYTVGDAQTITNQDIPRIVELYNMLYLQKYSFCNPMFNEYFIKLALQQQTLHLVAIRKSGQIDAILGYFCRNGIMTPPLFGYDTTLPQEIGLYRMLSTILFNIACENGHLLNASSGAAQFKRNRGAFAAIEYSAAYDQHLPWYRRLCWTVLVMLLVKVGVPLMQRYKL